MDSSEPTVVLANGDTSTTLGISSTSVSGRANQTGNDRNISEIETIEHSPNGTVIISITSGSVDSNGNVSNQTLEELCSKYVVIPHSFWNTKYLQHPLFDDIRCVFIRFVDWMLFQHINPQIIPCLLHREYVGNSTLNGSYPDVISLFVLNGSTNLSVDVIPTDYIVNIHGNCAPIEVTLNWNGNTSNSDHIPICKYESLSVSDGTEAGNQCFVIEYDDNSVRCGCAQFGTYSVETTQSKLSVAVEGNQLEYEKNVNYATTTWIICLWMCLILSLWYADRCDFDDEPLIAKEVYMERLSHLVSFYSSNVYQIV